MHSLMATAWDVTVCALAAGAALIVAVMALGLFVTYVRKRALERREASSAGFGIDSLEAMHRSGLISGEEFRSLRRKALRVDAPGTTGVPPVESATKPTGETPVALGENGLSPEAEPDDGKGEAPQA